MNRTIRSRRSFLKAVGLGSAAAIMDRTAWARLKQNVLFIAIDDLNDWVSCLDGHSQAHTPNLDRLAARGVLFTNAYCAAPACNPSRAALMTGIRPSTSGVYVNSQPWRKSKVLKDAETLPQYFMKYGYHALGSGKIFHGSFPDPESWNEYWPSQTKNKPDDPTPPKENLPLNGLPKPGHFDWGPMDVSKSEMGDWQVAEWVSKQLEREYDKPFFLACGFFRPHLPWYAPRQYFERIPLMDIELPQVPKNDLNDVPGAGKDMAKADGDHANVTMYGQWRQAVQAYLACTTFMDDCLGRVIDALDKSKYKDDTIIVLWSDHGWHLGEKLHWRKFALWEEATHNVLAIIAPGVSAAGGRCDSPVSLLDIYPTLVALAGLPPKQDLEGVSLRQLLRSPDALWGRPALTTHGKDNHSLRSERWRYIRYADRTEELYDHGADPLEWVNLANDPRYVNVKRDLIPWFPETNVPPDPNKEKKLP